MFLTFFSDNPEIDEVFLENYLAINVIPGLKRITGVGDAEEFGGKNYSMRIWLDPQKLQAYKLNPTEVTAAISSQSVWPSSLGRFAAATPMSPITLENPSEIEWKPSANTDWRFAASPTAIFAAETSRLQARTTQIGRASCRERV